MKQFSTKQTAQFLEYNDDSYIRKLITLGKIKAQKVGKQWLISEEEVLRLKKNVQTGLLISNTESVYPELFRFNSELRNIADSVFDTTIQKAGPKETFTIFSLVKSFKTQGAVLLLCQNGYGEDSAILVRSLFENLITLHYILLDKTDKTAQRFFDYDWVLKKRLYESVKNIPEIKNKIEQRNFNQLPGDTTIEDIQNAYQEFKKVYKTSAQSWSDKSIEKMAEVVGRKDEYDVVYRLQSNIVHSSIRSLDEYSKSNGTEINFKIGESENWVEHDLIATFDFFYSMVWETNKLLSLGLEEKLKALVKQYTKHIERINLH